MLSATIEPGTQNRVISSGPENLDHLESTKKTDVEASPASVASTTSASPAALRVSSPEKLAGDLHLYDNSLKFSPEELSSAPAEPVGMSCHGTLYKAVLSSGHVLAVKLLKEGIAKGRKEFAREAKKLGNIRHPNLVSLQGFYWGPMEHEKLIISKYIDAPCLALYLHGTILPYLTRFLEKKEKDSILNSLSNALQCRYRFPNTPFFITRRKAEDSR